MYKTIAMIPQGGGWLRLAGPVHLGNQMFER